MITMKAFKLFLLIFMITVLGILGFMVIEGWGFMDAFYMTIITITTTGFHEVHGLSETGRIFTVTLLGFGFVSVAYVSSQVVAELLATVDIRRRRRMEAKIKKLKDHAVVLGYGRMGSAVCNELESQGFDYVVIENNERLHEVLQEKSVLWIDGDAAHDEVLVAAGIERAKYLVSAVDSEADSLFAALAGRSLNPDIKVIVRADSFSSGKKMMMAGADKVVLPYVMSGVKVANSIVHPEIEDFFEISSGEQKDRIQLLDIKVKEDSALDGKSLRGCGFPREELMVVGVKKDGNFVFGPSADYVFKAGDVVIAVGTSESYDRALKILGI